jgi:flagellin-like hook-associated protein FlgL
MSDVTLSAAVRSSLLSLQNTTTLIDRTQNRLSSGLRVASSIDDPVAFFQAKTLSDRAFDFTEKKDSIDQGVSTVSAAIDGIDAIEAIVRQLKGVTNSLKSATGTQFTDLLTQFNDLRTQIGLLADDASYQGTNLVNNTSETLSVSFSEKTGSLLTVDAVNVRQSGLNIDTVAVASGDTAGAFNYSANTTNLVLSGGTTLLVTYQGSARTFTTAGITFVYGSLTITVAVDTAAVTKVASPGDTLTLRLATSVTSTAADFLGLNDGFASGGNGVTIADVEANNTNYILVGNSTQVDAVITKLDSALTTLRSNAQTLGSNVALLQTRLEFTEVYINTLETGGSKLTLADINEEGANLLALQTRQQLGISALAFAGQAEQGILALFR